MKFLSRLTNTIFFSFICEHSPCNDHNQPLRNDGPDLKACRGDFGSKHLCEDTMTDSMYRTTLLQSLSFLFSTFHTQIV